MADDSATPDDRPGERRATEGSTEHDRADEGRESTDRETEQRDGETDPERVGERESAEPGTDETATEGGDGESDADRDGAESDADADRNDGTDGTDTDGSEATSDTGDSAVPGPDLDEDDEGASAGGATDAATATDVPPDVRKYERFKKMDGAQYDRVNQFLRDRTYVTAREWAIARLCADFRTETGVEMTKIGNNLPRLVPFMTDTYTPQAVNQARASFEEKVRKAGATFLYGAMCGFFTAEELDETMYEVTEVAKFLLEVEGVELSVDDELAAEERISSVMREVRESSAELRGEEVKCPECGHVHEPE